MTDFEDSPRPAKRQKTDEDSHLSLSNLSTRAFRAFQGAVFGQIHDASVDNPQIDGVAHPNGSSSAQKDAGGSIWSKPLSTFEKWKLSRQQNNAQFGRKGANPPPASEGSAPQTPGKSSAKRKRKPNAAGHATVEIRIGGGTNAGSGFGEKEHAKRAEDQDVVVNGHREGTVDGADPIQHAEPAFATKASVHPEILEGSNQRATRVDSQPRTAPGSSSKVNGKISEPQISLLRHDKQKKKPAKHASTTLEDSEEDDLAQLARDLEQQPENVASGTGRKRKKETTIENDPTLNRHRQKNINTLTDGPSSEQEPLDALVQRSGSPSPALPIDNTQKLLDTLSSTKPDTLVAFQDYLLSRLTSKQRMPLQNLRAEYQKVHALLSQTVLAGEGNSMLLIGSRGSGKTTLVETCLSDLSSENQDDFHIIRLNGFIHTDDKLALREIWRQLGREMSLDEDEELGRTNYADALASLLALLSYSPAAEGEEGAEVKSKAIIFILDEFDLFASHPRQTLLYNLFDVAQSSSAPIAVLGLTTKINVVETLEKRVKSRFSQRYIHLSLPQILLPIPQSLQKRAPPFQTFYLADPPL